VISSRVGQLVIVQMDGVFLSAASALGGSVVGGLISGVATWANQRAQLRTNQLAHEISLRETMYRDFVIAASKAYAGALVSDQANIEDLAMLQAMIARMRIVSSPRIVHAAEAIHIKTANTYSLPNKTVSELHDAMKSGAMTDLLVDFSEAVREEARVRFPGVPWMLSH
jgi:hypothetical protein